MMVLILNGDLGRRGDPDRDDLDPHGEASRRDHDRDRGPAR